MTSSRAVSVSVGLLFALVLIVLLGLIRVYEHRVEQRAMGHLKTMLMLRESVLRSYFESLRSEVTLWSNRPVVIDFMESLQAAYQARGTQGLAEIAMVQTNELQSALRNRENTTLDIRVTEFAEHHGYYDVFFIGPDGDVLYTVAKEDDYGTNLLNGPYAATGLGRLFQHLNSSSGGDGVEFEDFSLYPPSNDEPAAFLGARVLSEGEYIGVYAVQIPDDPINEIMQFSAGMGETGEIYLVGDDGLMRSESRFLDSSSVLNTKVTGATVDKALSGDIGLQIVDDYRGVPVYSAYRLFEFESIRWAVLAEQDVAEVKAPIYSARLWMGGGFLMLCLIALLLRFMLLRVVLPTSIATFLGLTLLQMDDD